MGLPSNEPLGWYHRYLPHRDKPGIIQTITYRLADSLPENILHKISEDLSTLPPENQDSEKRKRLETYLDAGHGCCALKTPQAAQCIIENWKHFHSHRYDLIAWVVMPNHVHVMIHVYPEIQLGRIVQSWKGFTGKRIAQFVGEQARTRAGARGSQEPSKSIWMREYWDRFIRDETHFLNAIDYIHQNPVKAGLAASPEQWPWSSASL